MELRQHIGIDDLGYLTDRQRALAGRWMALQDTLNAGLFGAEMDAFFDPEMTYGNPSRPDLGTYAQWKSSPMELYKRLSPMNYATMDVAGRGDDTIWVHCHHAGSHTVGRYMGKEATGAPFEVEWFSTVTFRGDRILRIFSIADVLTMLIKLGVLEPSALPVDPYR